MKTLKQYIKESILDDEKELENLEGNIKDIIKQFLKDNYYGNSQYKISNEPDKDGKYIVNSEYTVSVRHSNCTSLTNGYFIFGTVKGDFDCRSCTELTSLEGSPKEVGGDFICNFCNNLISLKGSPEKVGGDFRCSMCQKLETLKGSPKEVGGDFICNICSRLKTLKGSPKEVGGDFHCQDCARRFTKEDVKRVSNVERKIYV